MHAKTHVELHDLKAGVVKARAEEKAGAKVRADERVAQEREDRVERIRELVLSVAESEHENYDAFEKLDEALDVRLEEDEHIFGSPEHPLRAVVESLCKEFSLDPDWSRWTGEGWLTEDPYSKPRFVSLKARVPAGTPNAFDPIAPPPIAPQPNGHALE
jgi:hypothetical protein